ncbi:hypothetical protein KFE94_14075 [bacterium SCSIO 12643]|nr:hypothetical protein KFE94_14075 [bacterium SCSIO 12643]
MAHRIINRSTNGLMYYCSGCKLIHIEFKNLNFNFSKKDFKTFARYMRKVEGKKWEDRNRHSPFDRKIVIPISDDNFNFLLNNEELEEFQELLNVEIEHPLITKLFKDLNSKVRSN